MRQIIGLLQGLQQGQQQLQQQLERERAERAREQHTLERRLRAIARQTGHTVRELDAMETDDQQEQGDREPSDLEYTDREPQSSEHERQEGEEEQEQEQGMEGVERMRGGMNSSSSDLPLPDIVVSSPSPPPSTNASSF